MFRRTHSPLGVFPLAVALLAASLATLSLPGERLRAASCGEDGEVLCSETETCSTFWIFRYDCSSSHEYFSKAVVE